MSRMMSYVELCTCQFAMRIPFLTTQNALWNTEQTSFDAIEIIMRLKKKQNKTITLQRRTLMWLLLRFAIILNAYALMRELYRISRCCSKNSTIHTIRALLFEAEIDQVARIIRLRNNVKMKSNCIFIPLLRFKRTHVILLNALMSFMLKYFNSTSFWLKI